MNNCKLSSLRHVIRISLILCLCDGFTIVWLFSWFSRAAFNVLHPVVCLSVLFYNIKLTLLTLPDVNMCCIVMQYDQRSAGGLVLVKYL